MSFFGSTNCLLIIWYNKVIGSLFSEFIQEYFIYLYEKARRVGMYKHFKINK